MARAGVLTLRHFDESEQQQLPPCTFQRAAAAAVLQLRQCFTCNEAKALLASKLRSPCASIVGARHAGPAHGSHHGSAHAASATRCIEAARTTRG